MNRDKRIEQAHDQHQRTSRPFGIPASFVQWSDGNWYPLATIPTLDAMKADADEQVAVHAGLLKETNSERLGGLPLAEWNEQQLRDGLAQCQAFVDAEQKTAGTPGGYDVMQTNQGRAQAARYAELAAALIRLGVVVDPVLRPS